MIKKILLLVTSSAFLFSQPALLSADDELLKYVKEIKTDEFNPDAQNAGAATPKRGGQLRLRVPVDFAKLNPLIYRSQSDSEILRLIGDSLISQNLQTQEHTPRMAWTYAKGDLLKLKDQPMMEGTFLKLGDESDPTSTFEFVPNAYRHSFFKGDVEIVDTTAGTLTVKQQWGGKVFTGEIVETPTLYTVNEALDPARKASTITGTLADLDTWRDRVVDKDVDRPFQKQECVFFFTLRDGINWHDGKPVTAQDILFSYETLKNPDVDAQRLRNYYDSIESAEILADGKTVKFLNRKPYFQQFEFLGGLPLLPRHVFTPEQFGGDSKAFADSFNTHPFQSNPILCGPYKFVEWKKDNYLKVARNEDYWASKLPAGSVYDWEPAKPYLDEITHVVINEKSVALKELQTGSIDADMDIEPDTWSLAETQTPEFTNQFVRAKKLGFLYTLISIKNDHPILKEKAVRQAIAHLIPREKIIRDVYFNLATPVSGPFFLEGPGYNHDVPQVEFDPEKARRILRRAGWLDKDRDGVIEKEIDGKVVPLQLEYMIHTAKDYHSKAADIIKENVEQVGIRLTIRKLDFNSMIEKTQDREFEMVRNAWGTTLDPDPYQIWHSSQVGNKGSNYAGFVNAEADALMVKLREEFSAPKRWEMAREIHRIIAEEQAVIFLDGFNETYFYNRGLRGVRLYPSQFSYDLTEWWWAKSPATETPAP
ncbi:MAG: ABC transporter substrate-binding protein [Candidatus Sumerlaeia bacterium]|nr:ABC transporter substrate-binding protein [Candidatus Sumerlaeia bacterium]